MEYQMLELICYAGMLVGVGLTTYGYQLIKDVNRKSSRRPRSKILRPVTKYGRRH